MKHKHFVSLLGLLAIAVVGMPSAIAADTSSGFYVGGNVGQSRVKIDTGAIDAAILSTGLVATSATTAQETDIGLKLFAGYRFHPNFAVEGDYFNLGVFTTTTVTTGPAVTLSGTAKNENGFNLDLVGIVPFNDSFSGFARLGVQNSETKISLVGVGPGGTAAFSTSESKTNWKAGLGLQYYFTKSIGARAEWERYRVPNGDGTGGTADVDLFSLGLVVRF